MARPRKSIDELKGTGTYRPSTHDKRKEAKEDSVSVHVDVPEYFSASTKKEFKTTYDYLNASGILTQPECTSLISCFDLYDQAERLRTKLQKMDVCDEKYRSLFTMYNVAVINFNKIIRGFGMVPADRGKVADLKKKEKAPDSILEILKAPAGKK